MIVADQIAIEGDPEPSRRMNLTLREGDAVSIRGPSGSGKTLLLRAISGLAPLSSGMLRWKGSEIADVDYPRYRASVLYLAQNSSVMIQKTAATVEHCLKALFELRVHRVNQFDRDRAIKILEALGKSSFFLQKECRTLSGGEAQVVALVRALVLEPEVLLLDEPTSGLDAVSAQLVEDLVAQWHHSGRGRAYLWVTHQEAQAERVGKTKRSLISDFCKNYPPLF